MRSKVFTRIFEAALLQPTSKRARYASTTIGLEANKVAIASLVRRKIRVLGRRKRRSVTNSRGSFVAPGHVGNDPLGKVSVEGPPFGPPSRNDEVVAELLDELICGRKPILTSTEDRE